MRILDSFESLDDLSNIRCFSNVTKGIKPFLCHEIKKKYHNKNMVIILENNHQINEYYEIFTKFFREKNILKFPAWDNIPFEEISPSQNILNDRFKSLSFNTKISDKKKSFVLLANLDSLLQMVPKKEYLSNHLFKLDNTNNLSLEQLSNKLYNFGYDKVSVVLEPYEYAVRGGIIDIWPVGEDFPIRADFFGDKIEIIKKFNPISQITENKIFDVTISCSVEAPRSKEFNSKFIENYRNLFGPSMDDQLFVHKLKHNIRTDGIENWLPLFYSKDLTSIIDYFDIDLILTNENFLDNIYKKLEKVYDLFEEKKSLIQARKENINIPIDPALLYLSKKKIKDIYNNKDFKEFSYFSESYKKLTFKINCLENTEFHYTNISNHEILSRFKSIIDNNQEKKIVISYSQNDEENKAIVLLKNIGVKNYRINKKSIKESFDNLDVIDLIPIPLEEGFELPLLKVITLNEIFKTKKKLIKPKRVRNNLINIAQLYINDLVVHQQHGIGKYLGLKTIKINGSPHDCLTIEYLEKAKLYVPVEDIRLISKFGEFRENISLDKLGGNNWLKRKSSVKRKIIDLANNLIILAAKRSTIKGTKFNIDDLRLQSFSKNFNFIETDDQLATLEEVYYDLKSGKLMDRLVCGDVGFGKTEIALRAAFIVADNSFTVLLVAPTTLLARQHYKNFTSRFAKLHKVELLDRNTALKNKKEIINRFISKETKILIATHAIFSYQLEQSDIGLVIIDEEQRFGVSHKEKIKKIKSNVHLLTLTATPIPRTLHMSLVGIKDLSLIKTPPVDRKSIETKVLKFDSAVIKKAFFKEKNRSGQIYVVVPNIKDIPLIKNRIAAIYPGLKVSIAHGKLTSKELEKVMEDFYSYKTDLLISTTIIEAGLDVPRANTLIVYKSDNFGLAQLHQLRGRIGRSDKKAYAYFTLEKNIISNNAIRRLKALQTMDALGAGMQLANYDLDIRGAGNLLGEEQSGQINQVGIEMYQRLLKECIDDIKGTTSYSNVEEIEVSIKLPILIPEKYIPDLSLRLSLYRRVGEMQDLKEIKVFKQEMINRFGLIPDEFSNYLNVMILKILARKCSISKIYILNDNYSVSFEKKRKNYSESFIKWITNSKNKIILKNSHLIKINHEIYDVNERLLHVIELVKTMIELLNKEGI